MKIVYQTAPDGRFIGQTKADESPLEPGVFLIPAGCVEAEPPTFDKGYFARWDGANWQIEAEPAIAQEEDPSLVSEQAIRFEAARRISALSIDYMPQERETWPLQLIEAKSVIADANALAPLLSAIGFARGLSVVDTAQLVLAKAQQLATDSGAILAAQAVLLAQEPLPDDYADDKHWPALP